MTNQANTAGTLSVRCAIYTRRSTKKRGAITTATQELRCRAVAKQHLQWRVLDQHVYCDEGTSACDRTGIDSLLEDARSLPRPFDCVIVASLKHLGQDFHAVVRVLDELALSGVYAYIADLRNDSRETAFVVTLAVMKCAIYPNYVLNSTEALVARSEGCRSACEVTSSIYSCQEIHGTILVCPRRSLRLQGKCNKNGNSDVGMHWSESLRFRS